MPRVCGLSETQLFPSHIRIELQIDNFPNHLHYGNILKKWDKFKAYRRGGFIAEINTAKQTSSTLITQVEHQVQQVCN